MEGIHEFVLMPGGWCLQAISAICGNAKWQGNNAPACLFDLVEQAARKREHVPEQTSVTALGGSSQI